MSDNNSAGWRDLIAQGNAARFLVITGGVALHAVSIYVVATIMPTVVADLGGMNFFAWTTTLYVAGSLTGAAAVPLVLGRTSPRSAYRLAFGLFLLGSLACATAPSMVILLLGRPAQGFGGGMLTALAYATVRQMFPPSLHARAITLFGSVWGIAAVIGPAIGGVFAQYATTLGGWRGAFVADLIIGGLFLGLGERALPRLREEVSTGRFPGLRLLLLASAALAVSSGGVSGRPRDSLFGIIAAALLVVSVLWLDGRSEHRLLPKGAFNPMVPLGAVSATLGFMILSYSPGPFIPYLLQVGHGAAPIIAGYVSAMMALTWTGASILTANQSPHGIRWSIGTGPVLMLAGMLISAWSLSAGPVWFILVGQGLSGIGIGLGWSHLCALLMQVAPPEARASAGPFITTTQTLASVFGSAIAGMVANLAGLPLATTPEAIGAAAAVLFLVLALFPLVGIFLAWQALRLTR